jgi:plastocyanin
MSHLQPKEYKMRLPSLAFIMFMGLSVGALAANLTISQKSRMFSSEEVTIRKGGMVTFSNDDTVPHNIMSTSPGNEFNLGSQPPGASTDVTFKQAGEVSVICAIHPRMKMTVKVSE